jgi:hypothetical protein
MNKSTDIVVSKSFVDLNSKLEEGENLQRWNKMMC